MSFIAKALSVVLCAASISAFAQSQESSQPETDAAKPVLPRMPYMDTDANAEAIKKGTQLGESLVKDILRSYETMAVPDVEQSTLKLKRKFDDIADPTLAQDRNKVLEFLGLNPEADTGLYYFLSWSMPMEMLRSYVIEAMWSGGAVVFKGVPPGRELGAFIADDLRQLVYGKGAAANVSIDPRLFDAYQVDAVPAIVFTTVRANMQCQGLSPVEVRVKGVVGTYDTCPALDPCLFWKVTGSVTTSYALDSFIDDGAAKAKPYREALARGMATGAMPTKEQKPFSGKWEDAISPSELLAAKEAAAAVSTPAGSKP